MPKRRNSKKGGMDSASPSSYSDAASYALATAGPGNTQWDNTFLSSRSQVPGNALVGLQGQTVGGRRRSRSRRRSRRRSRKGGTLGGIISNALAPATLLAMQQSYKRKKGGKGKRRSQKGGFWGGIISQALTPFTLLAMQQTYRRKKSGNQTRRRS
jgi:hypothetical protein